MTRPVGVLDDATTGRNRFTHSASRAIPVAKANAQQHSTSSSSPASSSSRPSHSNANHNNNHACVAYHHLTRAELGAEVRAQLEYRLPVAPSSVSQWSCNLNDSHLRTQAVDSLLESTRVAFAESTRYATGSGGGNAMFVRALRVALTDTRDSAGRLLLHHVACSGTPASVYGVLRAIAYMEGDRSSSSGTSGASFSAGGSTPNASSAGASSFGALQASSLSNPGGPATATGYSDQATILELRDTESGWTALHSAMYAGRISNALALLRAGASLTLRDCDGATPADMLRIYCANPQVQSFETDMGPDEPSCSPIPDFQGVADVFGWGSNASMQLGAMGNGVGLGARKLSVGSSGVTDGRYSNVIDASVSSCSIATGKLHSLFVSSDGKLRAVGIGKHGVLGRGDDREIAVEPVLVTQGGLDAVHVVSVAASAKRSAAIGDKGELFVWGRDLYTSDGHQESRHSRDFQAAVYGGAGAGDSADAQNAYLSAGSESDDTDSSFGRSISSSSPSSGPRNFAFASSHMNGMAMSAAQCVPKRVTQGGAKSVHFVQVALADTFWIALDKNGSLWGCGSNDRGTLAMDETVVYLDKPKRISSISPDRGGGVRYVCIGRGLSDKDKHVMRSNLLVAALLNSGEVLVWGGPAERAPKKITLESPQLGEKKRPFQTGHVVDIAVGDTYVVCVTNSGRVLLCSNFSNSGSSSSSQSAHQGEYRRRGGTSNVLVAHPLTNIVRKRVVIGASACGRRVVLLDSLGDAWEFELAANNRPRGQATRVDGVRGAVALDVGRTHAVCVVAPAGRAETATGNGRGADSSHERDRERDNDSRLQDGSSAELGLDANSFASVMASTSSASLPSPPLQKATRKEGEEEVPPESLAPAYRRKTLLAHCEDALARTVSVTNALDMLHISVDMHAHRLTDFCIRFLRTNFDRVILSRGGLDTLLSYDAEYLRVLERGLRGEDAVAADERMSSVEGSGTTVGAGEAEMHEIVPYSLTLAEATKKLKSMKKKIHRAESIAKRERNGEQIDHDERVKMMQHDAFVREAAALEVYIAAERFADPEPVVDAPATTDEPPASFPHHEDARGDLAPASTVSENPTPGDVTGEESASTRLAPSTHQSVTDSTVGSTFRPTPQVAPSHSPFSAEPVFTLLGTVAESNGQLVGERSMASRSSSTASSSSQSLATTSSSTDSLPSGAWNERASRRVRPGSSTGARPPAFSHGDTSSSDSMALASRSSEGAVTPRASFDRANSGARTTNTSATPPKRKKQWANTRRMTLGAIPDSREIHAGEASGHGGANPHDATPSSFPGPSANQMNSGHFGRWARSTSSSGNSSSHQASPRAPWGGPSEPKKLSLRKSLEDLDNRSRSTTTGFSKIQEEQFREQQQSAAVNQASTPVRPSAAAAARSPFSPSAPPSAWKTPLKRADCADAGGSTEMPGSFLPVTTEGVDGSTAGTLRGTSMTSTGLSHPQRIPGRHPSSGKKRGSRQYTRLDLDSTTPSSVERCPWNQQTARDTAGSYGDSHGSLQMQWPSEQKHSFKAIQDEEQNERDMGESCSPRHMGGWSMLPGDYRKAAKSIREISEEQQQLKQEEMRRLEQPTPSHHNRRSNRNSRR